MTHTIDEITMTFAQIAATASMYTLALDIRGMTPGEERDKATELYRSLLGVMDELKNVMEGNVVE